MSGEEKGYKLTLDVHVDLITWESIFEDTINKRNKSFYADNYANSR